jgi:thioredoxin 1
MAVGHSSMASEKVKTFTDADFEQSVKDGLVLVDFWAEWCAPCRRLAPTVDQLAEDYNGRMVVAKVNIDENPETPNRFFIRGIPTLLLFKNGDLKETIVGLAAKDDLVRVIDKHI